MINLSERQSLILELLRETGRPMTGAELSDLLGVSPRTLRNDIGSLNRVGLAPLVESGSTGYAVNHAAYREVLGGAPRVASLVEEDERLLVYLLGVEERSIYDVSMECFLSETSARLSLARLTPRLAECGLVLSIEGSTVRLLGEELNRRRLLGELVREALNAPVGGEHRLRRLLPGISLPTVELAIDQSLGETATAVDDISRQNLTLNLAICLQRAGATPESMSVHEITDSSTAGFVDRLLPTLAALFPDRPLGAAETSYLRRLTAVTLDGSASLTGSGPASVNVDEVIRRAIDECIEHFDVSVQREKLIASLTLHAKRLLARSDMFAYFRSGLRESLRTRSPFLYDVAVYLAHLISDSLGLRVSDDEISLLAIYLGLYTDHDDPVGDTISVTIVCPRYQTLREWLLTRLVEHFGERINIVDIVATVKEAEGTEADLILTTQGGSSQTTPMVEISALCSDLDLDTISAELTRAREARLQNKTALMLSRFLDPRLFFVDVNTSDAESTIDFLCGQLMSTQKVPASFADSVRTREEYSSTAFSHRFAVPHAMEFVAYDTTIAVLIPRAPIDWGESDVVMVLMLAINPDDLADFSAVYEPLIRLLCKPDTFSDLRKLREFDEFKSYLTERFAQAK